MTDKQQPADTLRHGSLKAAIWQNDTDKGPMFNTTLTRSYRDREGNWQETQSFRSGDLLGVGEITRAAYHRVNELKQEHYRGHDQTPRDAHKAKRQCQAPSNGHAHQR